MKQALLLFILTLLSFYNSSAQKNKFQCGVEVGPTLRFLYGGDSNGNNNPTLGFSSGFYFQYNYNYFVGIRTGLSYDRKSKYPKNQITGDRINSIEDKYYNLHYLVLPLLVNIHSPSKEKFFGNIGSYFGFLSSAREITESNGLSTSRDIRYPDAPTFDIVLLTGFGFKKRFEANFEFSVELRNCFGFYNSGDTSSNRAKSSVRPNTNSTGLLIGVIYNFKIQDLSLTSLN